jgi:hypothetical protein
MESVICPLPMLFVKGCPETSARFLKASVRRREAKATFDCEGL